MFHFGCAEASLEGERKGERVREHLKLTKNNNRWQSFDTLLAPCDATFAKFNSTAYSIIWLMIRAEIFPLDSISSLHSFRIPTPHSLFISPNSFNIILIHCRRAFNWVVNIKYPFAVIMLFRVDAVECAPFSLFSLHSQIKVSAHEFFSILGRGKFCIKFDVEKSVD